MTNGGSFDLITTVKVLIQCKLLSGETIPSTYMHKIKSTHTHDTDNTQFMYRQLKTLKVKQITNTETGT